MIVVVMEAAVSGSCGDSGNNDLLAMFTVLTVVVVGGGTMKVAKAINYDGCGSGGGSSIKSGNGGGFGGNCSNNSGG